MMKEKKSKLKKIKKRLRRSTIFLLFIALIANSFAWFIYTNKVSNSINVKVKSWKVTFDQDGNTLEDNVSFTVDSIYPGMTDFKDSINISNSGEATAYISYEISSVKIFDEIYTNQDYSSDELETLLSTNYPSITTFTVDDDEISTDESGNFSVQVTWPYESGDDEKDTYWGSKAYDFSVNNEGENPIEIVVKIKASQNKE